jgi:glucosamine-6-phosphate deaminase
VDIKIYDSKQDLGRSAADAGASVIREAIADRGQAHIIVATGASQFEVLDHLTKADGIDWTAVTAFHLDEYVGLPMTHPASFCLYLWKRFASRLPLPLKAFYYLNGVADPPTEAARVGAIITEHPIDVAFIGIGENSHIAFNDPPADFETEQPYLIVELDEACRQQQLGEGWFNTLNDVPKRAVSMSVRQILKSKHIICTVPDERKAQAVHGSVQGPITPDVPASILQQHAHYGLYLDKESASRLTQTIG